MKTILLTITLFSILAILSVNNFAQTNCTIEPGIGCGKIQIGITKSEIKSILGEGKQDSFTSSLEYENLGLAIQFESTNNTINKVLFVVNPKVWGSEKFNAFSGSLPMNLSFQTNLNQLTQIFGKPQEQAVFGDTTSIKYQGLEFGFRDNNLMFVEVSKVEQTSAKNQVTTVSQLQKIEKPTPTPTPTPFVAKSGTFEDCEIVISEGCRNYFFKPNNDEIHWKFLFTKTKTNDVLFIWNSKADNFALVVEPSTGGILAVTFNKKSRTKPAPNLKWEESKTSVQKKYPEPQINSVGNYVYKDFIFHFEDDKLSKITLNREATEAEIIAYNTQKAANVRAEKAKADTEKAKAEAAEAFANTIEGKAAKLMERLNVNINYINYLTERHNKIKAGNANNRAAQIIDDNWGEIPKLLKQIEATKLQSIDLIDKFLKDYGNKIDDATKSKLLEHRQKFGGNSLKPLPRP